MAWLVVLLIGLAVGATAKSLMPGRDPGGLFITILLGLIGAFVASWVGQMVGWYREGDGVGFIGAVIGAMIVLAIYRMVASKNEAGRQSHRRAF
jgi:uncharacterized membrane protein YeaQ/YmgE (transglycosylase-associated protein family)